MKIRTSSILTNTIAASGLALLLVACGGGDGSSTGTLNLAVPDAPVDDAEATLRLVDDNTAGALTGIVSGVENDPDCNDNGENVGAVYVFDSTNAIDDVDGTSDPVTSANVPNDGIYAYTVAFLPEGDYRIDFTCDADIDDSAIDADTDPTDGPVDFVGETEVTIMAGETTPYYFQIPAP